MGNVTLNFKGSYWHFSAFKPDITDISIETRFKAAQRWQCPPARRTVHSGWQTMTSARTQGNIRTRAQTGCEGSLAESHTENPEKYGPKALKSLPENFLTDPDKLVHKPRTPRTNKSGQSIVSSDLSGKARGDQKASLTPSGRPSVCTLASRLIVDNFATTAQSGNCSTSSIVTKFFKPCQEVVW